jgi:cyclopropane fatty-acyl-phospholipid synthase-like methyltransferase
MNARPDWWSDFFSGLVVEFWRGALPPAVTLAEADFLERVLRLTPGARVLDVPCGHGRLTVALARRGYALVGVDISQELLAAAGEDAAGGPEPGSAVFRHSDMRDLPWAGEFQSAFCAGSSFGFLGDAGDAAFLAAVARTLEPGGRFVLDASKAAECLFPAFAERHDFEKDGIRFEAENVYDPRRGMIENTYTITRAADRTHPARTETKLARHRVYTASEVCAMFEAAGFEVEALFGDVREAPFRLGSPQLFVVGRVPEKR